MRERKAPTPRVAAIAIVAVVVAVVAYGLLTYGPAPIIPARSHPIPTAAP